MTTTLLSIGAVALLFALFGLLRPRAGCGGNCAACGGGACRRDAREDEHG